MAPLTGVPARVGLTQSRWGWGLRGEELQAWGDNNENVLNTLSCRLENSEMLRNVRALGSASWAGGWNSLPVPREVGSLARRCREGSPIGGRQGASGRVSQALQGPVGSLPGSAHTLLHSAAEPGLGTESNAGHMELPREGHPQPTPREPRSQLSAVGMLVPLQPFLHGVLGSPPPPHPGPAGPAPALGLTVCSPPAAPPHRPPGQQIEQTHLTPWKGNLRTQTPRGGTCPWRQRRRDGATRTGTPDAPKRWTRLEGPWPGASGGNAALPRLDLRLPPSEW